MESARPLRDLMTRSRAISDVMQATKTRKKAIRAVFLSQNGGEIVLLSLSFEVHRAAGPCNVDLRGPVLVRLALRMWSVFEGVVGGIVAECRTLRSISAAVERRGRRDMLKKLCGGMPTFVHVCRTWHSDLLCMEPSSPAFTPQRPPKYAGSLRQVTSPQPQVNTRIANQP